ncbi:MAG: hypothetical protein QXP01_04625, partial [Candidatus Hadarchaeum sp.]
MTQGSKEQVNRSRRFSPGGLYSRGVVRTRGFVPVSPPEEPGAVPIRTRGAVRTRGEAEKVESWQELKPEKLGELLDELRNAQDGFPITVVVDVVANPQAPEAKAFLQSLHDENLLGADDTLWVVGEGNYEVVVPDDLRKDLVPEDAYLNVQEQESEKRAHVEVEALVSTLTPELVFVAAASTEELKKRLEKWQRRVLAV